MNCQELLLLVSDYLGGELVVEELRTVEIHLTGCRHCVMLIESYRYTMRLARALPKCEKLPSAVEGRLRKFLASHLGTESEKKDAKE